MPDKLYFYTYTDIDGVRQPSTTTVPDGKYARQVIGNAVISMRGKLDNDSIIEVKGDEFGKLPKLYAAVRAEAGPVDPMADRAIHPEVTAGAGAPVDPLASIPGVDAPAGAPIPFPRP